MKRLIIQKAIIKRGNKFLILRRSPHTPVYPKLWDFPGGKWEKSESLKAGIIREVREETNLKIEPIKIVVQYDIAHSRDLHLHFNVYSIKRFSGNVKIGHEHTAFKWTTREQILKHKTEPYLKLLLKRELTN